MPYFGNQYSNILFPIADEISPGLRNAQLGAIFAISSHFTLYDKKPAIVVMPTGSGKTSVLVLTAFIQRAKRVLVVTPSTFVRGQIYDEFANLKTLKNIGVLYKYIKCPRVYEVKNYFSTIEEWNNLNDYDVFVSTPNCIYRSIKDEIEISKDFFDLILVDEAHHSSADSWDTIINYFENAKKVLFTATPFRMDKKEIDGELVYSYPLSKAFDDKIFSEILFYPIEEQIGINNDIVLAREVEKIFLEDRENGFDHYLFVRTNSKKHVVELYKIYKENTKLKLKIVDSSKSYGYIEKTINQLKNKELDGVICVNMLGEGFDFPNLKIAAIHSPHKTLAATLQFIGRFVRTNTLKIGEAKFLAIENEELEIENITLYSQEIVWRNKIIEMSEGRIQKESEIKKSLNTFSEITVDEESYEKLSIYNLNPYFHVKIYSVQNFKFPDPEYIHIPNNEIVKPFISKEQRALVFVTRELKRPRWIASDQLTDIEHNLFVVYYDEPTRLLFIHSSIKTTVFYDSLAKLFTDYDFSRIPQSQINRVLADIKEPEFFSIGLLNRMGNSGESYKILTGPSTQNAISKADGRLYSSGHAFSKGQTNGEDITIGYSSASKVWSNRYAQLPIFINWCKLNAEKIISNKVVKTNSAYDDIPQGKSISEFPSEVYFATWHKDSYYAPPTIQLLRDGTVIYEEQLLDFEINLKKEENFNKDRIFIELEYDKTLIPISYSFQDSFTVSDDYDFQIKILNESDSSSLEEYLNEYPMDFYLVKDNEMIADYQLFSPQNSDFIPFDKEQIEVFNWEEYKTDKQTEYGTNNSIHETLKKYLQKCDYDVIVYDHGPGEIADFITFKVDEEIGIELYHVKAAKSKISKSNRVDEIYEVVGQVIKSLKWLSSVGTFRHKLNGRIKNKPEKIIKNTGSNISDILFLSKRINYELIIVQPGISKMNLTEKVAELLAACDYYVRNAGKEKLRVSGSV